MDGDPDNRRTVRHMASDLLESSARHRVRGVNRACEPLHTDTASPELYRTSPSSPSPLRWARKGLLSSPTRSVCSMGSAGLALLRPAWIIPIADGCSAPPRARSEGTERLRHLPARAPSLPLLPLWPSGKWLLTKRPGPCTIEPEDIKETVLLRATEVRPGRAGGWTCGGER